MLTKKHPEQKDDEIFFGNFDPVTYSQKIKWVSKRSGTQCFHSDMQTPLLSGGFDLKPVFIKRVEAIQRGMSSICS